jgi:hypothetical protein
MADQKRYSIVAQNSLSSNTSFHQRISQLEIEMTKGAATMQHTVETSGTLKSTHNFRSWKMLGKKNGASRSGEKILKSRSDACVLRSRSRSSSDDCLPPKTAAILDDVDEHRSREKENWDMMKQTRHVGIGQLCGEELLGLGIQGLDHLARVADDAQRTLKPGSSQRWKYERWMVDGGRINEWMEGGCAMPYTDGWMHRAMPYTDGWMYRAIQRWVDVLCMK